MEKNKSILFYNIVLIFCIFLLLFLIFVHNFSLNTNTLIGTKGITTLKNQLANRLISYVFLSLILFIFLFIMCKFLIIKINKIQISNINIFLLILFNIIIFLCSYSTPFNFLHKNIKNNNFLGFIKDINLISLCQKDIIEDSTYSIICNHLKTTTYRTRKIGRHSGPDIIEYGVELSLLDKASNKSNVLDTVFISENDCIFIGQLPKLSYRSYYKITIYKNTKLIKNIEIIKK